MFKNIIPILALAVLITFSANAKDIQKATFTASMESNKCKNKIEKVLKSTDGVEKINIDLKDKSVKVEYDKDKVSEEVIASAIKNATSTCSHDSKSADKKEGCNPKSCSKSCNKPCGEKKK